MKQNDTTALAAAPKTSDVSTLRFYVEYEPDTGILRWKSKAADKCVVGAVIGSKTKNGYIQLQVEGRKYYAHRLAWALAYGEFPECAIDHINGDRCDNRISNLRLATPVQNSRNSKKPVTNKSGAKGVSWVKSRRRWLAQIALGNGKTKNLGRFQRKDDAILAYRNASLMIHGEFSRIS